MAQGCQWPHELAILPGRGAEGSTKNRFPAETLVECVEATLMTQPSCDRHKNLQMVPFPFEDPTGKVSGYICPVPACGRLHDKEGYFDVVEGKIVRLGNAKELISPLKEQILNVIRSKAEM